MGMGSVEWTDCRLVKEGGFRLIVVGYDDDVDCNDADDVVESCVISVAGGWRADAGWLACRTTLTQQYHNC